MRGKKKDSEFLSNFITDCIQNGITSTNDIVNAAKNNITIIDEEIKKVEKLKVTRSKLLDVITAFEKQSKSHKEEIKVLSFFTIQHPNICKFICSRIKSSVVNTNELSSPQYALSDILFCIKQLVEHKIIVNYNNHLLKGERFEEYMAFVFREV